MKKKSKTSAKKTNTKRVREDAPLSSELGSFGLEPPKRYRNEESTFQYDRSYRDASLRSPAGREPSERGRRSNASPSEKHTKGDVRKRSKLKRKIIFSASLTVALLAFIVVLCLTVLFKINTITIKGNEVYSVKEVSAVLPIEKGANLFVTNTKAAEKKLVENLPYIYSVSIKRKLPSTITVTITETPTVYYIETANKTYTFLDGYFKVLDTGVANIPQGGIAIREPAATSAIVGQPVKFKDEKTFARVNKLSRAVENTKNDKITAISSKDINNNFVTYDNRITIKVGNTDNLDNKLNAALTAIHRLNETNPQAKGTMTATNDKQIYFTEDN